MCLDSHLTYSGDKAVIIEQTKEFSGKCVMGVPASFHWKYKTGSMLTPLDDSISKYVECVHIILPSMSQFYSAARLNVYPHYTLSIGKPLDDLIRKATILRKQVKVYEPDLNYIDDGDVRVLNSIDNSLSDFHAMMQKIDLETITHGLEAITSRECEC